MSWSISPSSLFAGFELYPPVFSPLPHSPFSYSLMSFETKYPPPLTFLQVPPVPKYEIFLNSPNSFFLASLRPFPLLFLFPHLPDWGCRQSNLNLPPPLLTLPLFDPPLLLLLCGLFPLHPHNRGKKSAFARNWRRLSGDFFPVSPNCPLFSLTIVFSL